MEQPVLNTLPKFKNKQEIAYGEIRDAIIQCRFRPGDALVIRTLAAQLGISEIPVREALKRLISENFVMEENSALRVSPISAGEFLDMMDVKLGLELMSIQLSARKITGEQVGYLKRLLDSMEEYFAENDLKSYRREHQRFHLECCLICGIPYLMSAISASFAHHERALTYFDLALWEEQPSLREHSDILNALARHDPEEARRRLAKNRERADNFYRKQLAELVERN